jgi:hypothetical protein
MRRRHNRSISADRLHFSRTLPFVWKAEVLRTVDKILMVIAHGGRIGPTALESIAHSAVLGRPSVIVQMTIERTGHVHRSTVNLGFPQTELRC